MFDQNKRNVCMELVLQARFPVKNRHIIRKDEMYPYNQTTTRLLTALFCPGTRESFADAVCGV